jgi:hypothetical protein
VDPYDDPQGWVGRLGAHEEYGAELAAMLG